MALGQPLDTGSQSMHRRKAHGMWSVAMACVYLVHRQKKLTKRGPDSHRPARAPCYFCPEKL